MISIKRIRSGSNQWLCRVLILLGILVGASSQYLTVMADDEVISPVLGNYLEKAADRFYNTKEIPGNLELALEYYKKSLEHQSGVEWKIARCYWVLAKRAWNEKELQHYHQEGIRYGKLAIKNHGNNSNTHLWYSLIVGASAMRQGVVRTLYNREAIKSSLETAIRLDPDNTNAYVGLAGWYFFVPAIFGGDKEEGFRLINKAIELEPDYTSARLVKAEFLISEQHYHQAEQVLKDLMRVKTPVIRGDGIEDKRKAGELLKDLKLRTLNS
jgi:tetratricopeptide (TPR) repeat protein